ncbi:MAG: arylesterase [Acidobacteria bacterium]|nr:arylesterase [Acidobacteriota bacterium]
MSSLSRIKSLICFGIVIFAVSCGGQDRFTGGQGNVERPLVYPQTVATRPKIIAFGDSLTAGFGLSETESYPYLLQQRLNAEGYNYEVVNAGVSGDTSLGGSERAEWTLEQEGAKILILELGANDMLRAMPPARMKANLENIIKKAQELDMKILLCGMFAAPTLGNEYQQEFNAAFPDLADKYKTAFLPFPLENIALKPELNQGDGIHPNAEGTKIMTENIYTALLPLLEK